MFGQLVPPAAGESKNSEKNNHHGIAAQQAADAGSWQHWLGLTGPTFRFGTLAAQVPVRILLLQDNRGSSATFRSGHHH
jgi:hypothetical protein